MSNASQAENVNTEHSAADLEHARRFHERGAQQAAAVALNGAQLEAIRKQMIAEFQRAVDDVEMRKQAVDAVCKIIAANPAIAPHPVQLAQDLYAFMAEPAAEIVVKVS